jgi:hypothetical protein
MTHIFELRPMSPFRLDLTVWKLRRRPHKVSRPDRFTGDLVPASHGPKQ